MTNKEILENDVVKVVRCKDCKYSHELQTKLEKAIYCDDCIICTNGEISDTEFAMWNTDFCSYGEREENDCYYIQTR